MFDEEGALDNFEAFASLGGPAFYGLPVNGGRLTLKRGETRVPKDVAAGGGDTLRPFLAGESVGWTVVD